MEYSATRARLEIGRGIRLLVELRRENLGRRPSYLFIVGVRRRNRFFSLELPPAFPFFSEADHEQYPRQSLCDERHYSDAAVEDLDIAGHLLGAGACAVAAAGPDQSFLYRVRPLGGSPASPVSPCGERPAEGRAEVRLSFVLQQLQWDVEPVHRRVF